MIPTTKILNAYNMTEFNIKLNYSDDALFIHKYSIIYFIHNF